MERVYVGGDADKLGLVNQAIRRGTDFALGDQFIQSRARDAELARRVGFGESRHAPS
jgi:hypothetical protein